MENKIIEIVTWVAPIAAGFVTSTVIPFLIKRIAIKKLEKKIDDVANNTSMKEIEKRLNEINNQLLEMRGKRK